MHNKGIDYDTVSTIYDDVRSENLEMVMQILKHVEVDSNSLILDIGCGTANNTHLLMTESHAEVIGLE